MAAGGIVLLLWIACLLRQKHTPLADAVGAGVIGYTNAPGSTSAPTFALIMFTNRADYDIRWRGDWAEVEGVPYHKARIMSPNLPGSKLTPILKSGQTLLMAVGEPTDLWENPQLRWRFTMSYSRYGYKEKWGDIASQYKLPLKVGRLVLADPQSTLDPSNRVEATTLWLTKAPSR